MQLLDHFISNVKRAETPTYRRIKKLLKIVISPPAPRPPRLLKPAFRALYELHFLVIVIARSLTTFFYRQPLFQSRCASTGKNLRIDGKMPYVYGNVDIHLGDDVSLGGGISILAGGPYERARVIVKDRVAIGWNTSLAVGKEIIIEEDVIISFNCRISDTDGHPKRADLRAKGEPPSPRDIRPVRICRYAWIGNGAHILKGTTIGEGAIVGANSVVMTDVPPYAVALGNPAEVLFRNVRRPCETSAGAQPA